MNIKLITLSLLGALSLKISAGQDISRSTGSERNRFTDNWQYNNLSPENRARRTKHNQIRHLKKKIKIQESKGNSQRVFELTERLAQRKAEFRKLVD
jgi:hypothetical protein